MCLFVICCSEGQNARLMVPCAEDRLARRGEGRRSILLTKHYVIHLRILRPDSRPSNGSMVQHFIGGFCYCGILGSEDGTFSARISVLPVVFQCFSCCHTLLNSTRHQQNATKEFPTTEKFNSFVSETESESENTEEIQKEKGDARALFLFES